MVSDATAVAVPDAAEAPGAAGPALPVRPPVPPKRYRVGEIVAHTGLSRQTLHNYTHRGLIRAAGRTAGGHRLYDESVFARLARIASLKTNARLEEVRRRLDAPAAPSPAYEGGV